MPENREAEIYIRKLHEMLPELKEKYHVSYLGIFGSYIRGEQKPGSDLDILVEFSKTPTIFKFVNLENYLSEALGIKVDLVMKDWSYKGHPLETTTMPGWAGSSWYFLRYMDANNDKEFASKIGRASCRERV